MGAFDVSNVSNRRHGLFLPANLGLPMTIGAIYPIVYALQRNGVN